MRRWLIVGVVAMLTLGACGDDDGDDAQASSGDVERYCDLTNELDEAGSEAFDALEDDENATEEDFARVMEGFIEAHVDEFQERRRVAPEEIRTDVDRMLDGIEAGAHADEQPDENVAEAEQRVLAFEEANCS